jgi:hypothetical protein
MSCPRGSRIALVCLLGFLVGCGGGGGDRWSQDRPATVPAGGTVLYNQKPVEGASVTFIPQGHDHGAVGRTDASGRFQLQTFAPNDGAVPGEFKVTVRKVEVAGAGEEDAPEFDEDTRKGEEQFLVPEKYAAAESTDLTVTIPDGGNRDITLELTD